MSGRGASTCAADGCCNPMTDVKSLHEKLHALEVVRAKEMHAHGQLVQQLETQRSVCRQSEKELQLTVAKLRAEKCRLEAVTGASGTKLRGLEEKADSDARQHGLLAADFRLRLLAKEEEITRLQQTIEEFKREKMEAAIMDAERATHVGLMKREIDRITAERDDARVTLSAGTQEVSQLASRLAVKQAELDAERKKTEQLHRDFDTQAKELSAHKDHILTLTRACERLEITRLRLAAWGRVRVGIMEQDVRFRDVFLEWKAQTLATKATRTQATRLEAQQRLEKLGRVWIDLDAKLGKTRITLGETKQWLQSQKDDFRAWQDLYKIQFASAILTRFQQTQAETLRACDEKVATLKEQLQNEKAKCVAEVTIAREVVHTSKATFKRHMSALLWRIAILQHGQLRAQAFQGWKDVYLRNVVAETTHAVMVARSAQLIALSSPPRDPVNECKLIEKQKLEISSSSKLVEKRKISLRQPQRMDSSFVRGEEEEQWKRWRRVAPADAMTLSISTRRSSITSVASTTPSAPSSTMSTRGTKASTTPVSSTCRRRASLI